MAEKQIPVVKPTAQTTETKVTETTVTNTVNTSEIELTADEKQALAEKRKLAVKEANDKKIADLLTKISEADKRLAFYQGEEEDKVAFREFTKTSRPEAWKAINELPSLLRADLAEFKLSIVPKEVKDKLIAYEAHKILLKAATDKHAALHADILATYPDIDHPDFVKAPVQKVSKPKTGKTGETTTAESKDGYMGTLLSNEAATAKTIEVLKTLTGGKTVAQYLKDGGTLSESETVKLIYPGDYSYAAKGSDGRSPLKFHYHTIWNKLVLSQR